jgi:acyl-CoA thioesterase-1
LKKLRHMKYLYCFQIILLTACFPESNSPNNSSNTMNDVSVSDDNHDSSNNNNTNSQNFKLLSLGDSYTIGESVCDTCRFPEQLKDSLITKYNNTISVQLKIIAQTGWTTTNLINAIDSQVLDKDYDLVTLLIGVNNQYQRKPFSNYQTEFPLLVNTSIDLVKGDKTNVIVVSIPDYAYTPFGQGNSSVSAEIDFYNAFAKNYCEQNDITFVNITDITRQGLINTDLVASDGLHPSSLAYSFFVERILPLAINKLSD